VNFKTQYNPLNAVYITAGIVDNHVTFKDKMQFEVILTLHRRYYVEIKIPTRSNR